MNDDALLKILAMQEATAEQLLRLRTEVGVLRIVLSAMTKEFVEAPELELDIRLADQRAHYDSTLAHFAKQFGSEYRAALERLRNGGLPSEADDGVR